MIKMQEIIDYVKAGVDPAFTNFIMKPGTSPIETPEPYARFQRLEGNGLSTEGAFDGTGFQVETVGRQGNYSSAEDFALAIDARLLATAGSFRLGTTWVLQIQRFTGGPFELEQDDGERHHFVCSYLLDVQSGLPY